MKLSSSTRAGLLAGAFTLAGVLSAAAQTTNTPPAASCPPGGHPWHHESVLTPAERAELKKDREEAFAANPALKTQAEALRSDHPTKDSSPADKQAFHAKRKAFMEQLDTAIEGVDPNAAPILAKLKAAHPHHHHDADASTDDSSDTSNP